MRNMSFSMTTQQVRDGTKTVTRRLGWRFLKPGDRLMAVVKSQGLKKGEKVSKIRPIEVVNASWETLRSITQKDCELEGFPHLAPSDFIAFFCNANHCLPTVLVRRIEFKYL